MRHKKHKWWNKLWWRKAKHEIQLFTYFLNGLTKSEKSFWSAMKSFFQQYGGVANGIRQQDRATFPWLTGEMGRYFPVTHCSLPQCLCCMHSFDARQYTYCSISTLLPLFKDLRGVTSKVCLLLPINVTLVLVQLPSLDLSLQLRTKDLMQHILDCFTAELWKLHMCWQLASLEYGPKALKAFKHK